MQLVTSVVLLILADEAAAKASALQIQSGDLLVTVEQAGDYSVSVNSERWLKSSPPTHLGRSLAVIDLASSSGADKHGAFKAITVRWRLVSGREAVLETVFTAYTAETIAFTQRWPLGVGNASSFFNSSTSQTLALGQFPSFFVGNSTTGWIGSTTGNNVELNYFAFMGCQIQYTGFGRWSTTGPRHFRAGGAQSTMPLLLYDRTLRAIGLSPVTNFFNAVHETASFAKGDVLSAGIMASVERIPAGFEHTTFLVGGHGMNDTMNRVGGALLAEAGKTPIDPAASSFVLSHLGYWVDNGSPVGPNTAMAVAYLDAYASSSSLLLERPPHPPPPQPPQPQPQQQHASAEP
jgi:hypothetical protein